MNEPKPLLTDNVTMTKQPITTLLLCGAILACTPPDLDPSMDVAIRHATAARFVADADANPGSLEAICVTYANATDEVPLPDRTTAIAVFGPDGCEDVQGGLRAKDSGAQAWSVTVYAPEVTRRGRATVSVITSTGSRDVAAYECTATEADGRWTIEECDLQAIS